MTTNIISKYYPLPYNYHKMVQYIAKNITSKADDVLSPYYTAKKEECLEIVRDLAFVKVRLGSNKYMKSVRDKRMTFADKLAAFGKTFLILDIHKYTKYFFIYFSIEKKKKKKIV